MSVSEFVDRWLQDSMQPSNGSDGVARDKSVLYLKDWHFVKVCVCMFSISVQIRFFVTFLHLVAFMYSCTNSI